MKIPKDFEINGQGGRTEWREAKPDRDYMPRSKAFLQRKVHVLYTE